MSRLNSSIVPYFDLLNITNIRSQFVYPLPDGEENISRLKAQGICWQGLIFRNDGSFEIACLENSPSQRYNALRPRLYARLQQIGEGCRVVGLIRIRWFPRVMLTVFLLLEFVAVLSSLLLKAYVVSAVSLVIVILTQIFVSYQLRDAAADWPALERGVDDQLSA